MLDMCILPEIILYKLLHIQNSLTFHTIQQLSNNLMFVMSEEEVPEELISGSIDSSAAMAGAGIGALAAFLLIVLVIVYIVYKRYDF